MSDVAKEKNHMEREFPLEKVWLVVHYSHGVFHVSFVAYGVYNATKDNVNDEEVVVYKSDSIRSVKEGKRKIEDEKVEGKKRVGVFVMEK